MITSVNSQATRTFPAHAHRGASGGCQGSESSIDCVQLSQDRAEAHKPEYAPGEVLVKFKPGSGLEQVKAQAESLGLSVIRHFQVPESRVEEFGGELYQLGIKGGASVEDAVAQLSGRDGIAYAEPNYLIQVEDGQEEPPPSNLPNDLDSRLWGLKNAGQDGGTAGVDINATGAWEISKGATSENAPLIAVIDTGIDYNHPDLAANIWTNPGEIAGDGIDNDENGYVDDVHGANMIAESGDPMDDNRHGTHCAGTIGAVGNNGEGVVGVNWNANMAGVKFLSGSGGGTYADAIEAVLYADRIGARVTSNSWGGTGFSEALQDAFAGSPALHIAAAGNSSADADRRKHYPSGFELPNIVSVAAHDRNDRMASFSNYGATSVDVAAPGVDIFSTVPGGGYQSLSGTSMATPHVSGVVGLMLANNPELTNEQIKNRLINTAIPGEAYQGKMVSGGRVSALNVLENDEIAPAPAVDFHISDIGATGIEVGWTATGDDGMEGQATRYLLRMSDRPITPENFSEAVAVPATPAPGAPGTEQSVRVGVLPSADGEKVFFGLQVLDNMGNASPLTTGAARTKQAAVAFYDDLESENENWTADGAWAKVQLEGHGQVYTDSPGGSYPPSGNTALTSRPFDLSTVGAPVLQFKMKHDTERNFDKVFLEISSDGENWSELASYHGLSDWSDKAVDLSAYEDQTVQVRFRLTSDRSIQKDGVYIDDIQVAGDPKIDCHE